MKRNLDFAQIFRDAALLYLHDGSNFGWPTHPNQTFSCYAIDMAAGFPFHGDPFPLRDIYAEYFKPADVPPYRNWFESHDYDWDDVACQEHRCLCLLLMADILENS